MRLLAGIVATAMGFLHWHSRPHIITTLFFTYLVLTLVYYYKTEENEVLYPIPFLMVFWANLHGAFISGLVQIVLVWIGLILEKKFLAAKTIMILFFTSLLATLINPFGMEMITHSFGYLRIDYLIEFTNEYNSPNFHHVITWPYLGVLLLTIILGWYSTKRVGWVILINLFFWTASSLYFARNIPLYGQVAVLFLAYKGDKLIDEVFPKIGRFLSLSDSAGKRSWGWMWGIGFASFLIFLQANGGIFDVRGLGNNFDPNKFPIRAIETLEEEGLPDGYLLNEIVWGGYLLNRLGTEKLVFIDGQTDFYGEDLTRIHEETISGEGEWRLVLDEYEINWILLKPDRPLVQLLSLSQNWEEVYSDNVSSVFVRR